MATERNLSAPLLIGTLALPAIFVWFLLRSGYSSSLRRAAFTYFIVITAVAIIGRSFD